MKYIKCKNKTIHMNSNGSTIIIGKALKLYYIKINDVLLKERFKSLNLAKNYLTLLHSPINDDQKLEKIADQLGSKVIKLSS